MFRVIYKGFDEAVNRRGLTAVKAKLLPATAGRQRIGSRAGRQQIGSRPRLREIQAFPLCLRENQAFPLRLRENQAFPPRLREIQAFPPRLRENQAFPPRLRGGQGGGAIVFTLLILLCAYSSFAANVSLELSPRKITVGDPVEILLSVNVPKGVSVVWPSAEQLKPAEILKADTLARQGERQSIRYSISLFEPGRTKLPDLPVLIVEPGRTDTLLVDPGVVEVKSILEQSADSSLRDVKPPVRLGWTLKELLPYIFIAVSLIAAAIVGYIFWRRYKHRKGELPVYVPSPLPPHIIALRKLEELRIKRLWQDGYIKEFHSELTDIIKEYIEKRCGFPALEMTSEEVFERHGIWAPTDDLFIPIRRMLTCADLVKFAKFKPDPRENERGLNDAFAYVEATKDIAATGCQPSAVDSRTETPDSLQTTGTPPLSSPRKWGENREGSQPPRVDNREGSADHGGSATGIAQATAEVEAGQ